MRQTKGLPRISRRPRTARKVKTVAVRGAKLVTRFIDDRGTVVVDDVADWFGMSKAQLATTVGVRPETFQRVKRVAAPRTQSRIKEMLEIIGRVADWAGGKDQAMAWYRAVPIPAFGGRTAESLVKEGKAAAVRDYLDHVAVGGFA
jgi:putative toxin-antitoxin system antitoxin component (TIGR02293 family)